MPSLIPLQAGEPVLCPSGLKIAVREMLVDEERLLADKRLQRSGRFSTELLDACVTEIFDHGPYEPNSFSWRSALQGDRFVALLAVRVATYGPFYDFSCTCGECSSRIRWRLNLAEDLKVKPCPEESLAALRSGEPLEVDVNGAMVAFKLPTGIEEEQAAKILSQGQAAKAPLSTAIKIRVSSIKAPSADGLEELKGKALGAWISKLSMGAARKLRAAFDEADCGVETEIEIDCPTCQSTQAVEVPFGRAFWMPE